MEKKKGLHTLRGLLHFLPIARHIHLARVPPAASVGGQFKAFGHGSKRGPLGTTVFGKYFLFYHQGTFLGHPGFLTHSHLNHLCFGVIYGFGGSVSWVFFEFPRVYKDQKLSMTRSCAFLGPSKSYPLLKG